MCGICGTVAVAGEHKPPEARARVAAMLKALSHRGPDSAGSASAEFAELGATRLAIRGLVDGNQPMADADSGVIAVCNGEIDNHRELRAWLADRGRPVRQETDVAVIPGLYLEHGPDFVAKLVGAFAVAVWDPRTRCLILARDRAGERPLFFAHTPVETIFATEVAAIVSQGRLPVALDRGALQKYLQFGIFPAPETPFEQIEKVGPGELVQIDGNGVRRQRYWRWANVETPKRPASLDAFDQTFRHAVRRQSDVDVNFGVFLSGGIDSSLVSAVARTLHPTRSLKAFTLRFEEESYDEGDFAHVVATKFGMELVPVWVRPEDVRREVAALVRLVGEPLADPAWLPAALLARRAAQDIRLALVGEGADELFGGYPTYIGAGVAERFARLPRWLQAAVRRAVEALPPSEKKVTVSFLLKRFVQGAGQDGMTRHRLWVSNIAPPLLERLGVTCRTGGGETPPQGELLDHVQRWDLESPLAEGLLTKADRSSMSYALELRAPFLDEAVLEFARALPVSERVRGFQTKVFLKRYAARYLPREIVYRRKRGLSVPIGRWLRGPLYEWAEAALSRPHLEQAGLRPAAVLELFSDHCQRKVDHARALWTLLVLSEWLEWVADETASSPAPM